MKLIIVALFVALIVNARPAIADSRAYSEVVELKAQGNDFSVVHHHDWSYATKAKRVNMMNTHADPFRKDNNYGYVAWYARDGSLVRQLPSPALTWLGVSPDSRYVIGLSNVMLDNPYQLVVWSRAGELLAKRHITLRLACLRPERYRELSRAHSARFDFLRERVWTSGGVVYVDFLTMGMRDRLGKLWQVLYSQTCAPPWSSNFSESVTNWVHWFDEDDPAPVVVEAGGKPSALRLKDPKGIVFTVAFHLEVPSR